MAVLALNAPADRLWTLLFLEMVVQCVELAAYVFFIRGATTVDAVTRIRYYDWVITTPVMLFTLAAYMDYARGGRESLADFARRDAKPLAAIALSNAAMVMAGCAAERGMISRPAGLGLGFAAYAVTFSVLWREYARHSPQGRRLFALVSATWALYGVAFALEPTTKNAAYNLLDVVAKNFFGVFLAWKVATLHAD